MKVNRNVEAIIVAALYLTCLYFWTLPIQKNPVPYGEVDAVSHYAVADYTTSSDRSITTLPYYIDMRYGKDNKFKEHTLWYPPPFHTTLAIARLFGGNDQPIFIANAILCSLIVISVYFLIRQFFGFEAGILAAFMLIFSVRDIMVYLWGQWPERMGLAFLPLVLYCFYRYAVSYLEKDEKPIYIYLMAIFLGINMFIHPMDFFHTAAAVMVLSVFLFIKERRLFFNIKHVAFAIVIFGLLISIFPYQTLNVFVRAQSDKETGGAGDVSRLFYWFKAESNPGVPDSYFSYKQMIGPYWTIPLIFLGLLFLVMRRERKDLVLLAWIISLYIILHLDFIGRGRVHRSLSATAHIFYPLMVLGLFYIISLIPTIKNYKSIAKPAFAVIFGIILFASFGTTASESLFTAYSGLMRVNPSQVELANWMRESSTPDDAGFYHLGSISVAKTRWLWMMGHRFIVSPLAVAVDQYNITYVIVDYSDVSALGDKVSIDKLREWESTNSGNMSLIYNKNTIKVYELGTKQ